MKFKACMICSFLSILIFTGCDTKGNKEKNQTNTQTTDQQQSITPSSSSTFILNSIDNKPIEIVLDEGKIFLKGEKNKLVLLNFFTTWCPPCKAEIPNLVKLQESFKNDLVVIGVLLEEFKTNEEIAEFLKPYNANYTVTNSKANINLAKAMGGIKSIPSLFLIDQQASLFQKYTGLVPFEMMEIDVKKLLER